MKTLWLAVACACVTAPIGAVTPLKQAQPKFAIWYVVRGVPVPLAGHTRFADRAACELSLRTAEAVVGSPHLQGASFYFSGEPGRRAIVRFASCGPVSP
jgi:hypothetical protein